MSRSLPAGILEDVEFEHKKETLTSKDVLIMMSDGISESFEDDNAVLEIIAGFSEKDSPKAVASEILARAHAARGKNEGDDMTAIAAKIIKK